VLAAEAAAAAARGDPRPEHATRNVGTGENGRQRSNGDGIMELGPSPGPCWHARTIRGVRRRAALGTTHGRRAARWEALPRGRRAGLTPRAMATRAAGWRRAGRLRTVAALLLYLASSLTAHGFPLYYNGDGSAMLTTTRGGDIQLRPDVGGAASARSRPPQPGTAAGRHAGCAHGPRGWRAAARNGLARVCGGARPPGRHHFCAPAAAVPCEQHARSSPARAVRPSRGSHAAAPRHGTAPLPAWPT
jgi:hypothetical protein